MPENDIRSEKGNTDSFIPLTTIGRVRRIPLGVECEAEGEKIRMEFIQPDVARLKVSRAGVFDEKPTFAVANHEFGPVPFTLKETPGRLLLESREMRIEVGLDKFSFDVYRADGSMVLTSAPGWAYSTHGARWAVKRSKSSRDVFLGFGQKTGPLNQNGRYLQMWNFNIWDLDLTEEAVEGDSFNTEQDPYYISVPFFYHLPEGNHRVAAASFIDNGYRLHYDLTEPGGYTVVGDGGQLIEYIFTGPSMKSILSRYTELTGRMEAPPLWALGHHQSRWYKYREQDFREMAEYYRNHHLPCDSLWFDIDYMDDFKIFTWDKERFPDPPALIRELKEKGFRTLCNTDPAAKHEPGYFIFDHGKERDYFCKTGSGRLFISRMWGNDVVFCDFVKEKTRRWWENLIAGYVELGLDGAWIDMNEPSIAGADENEMRFDRDGDNHDHARYRNQYALLMARSTQAGLKKARQGIRPFVISRSGFAGIQRYSAVWTGDNASRWEHLRMSVTMCCNLGLSGLALVGSDIGGFVEDCTEELLVRWYQYAVFQPFCRNHSANTATAQFPWSFGENAEKLIRASLELRYALLPYIYTCFMRSAETGEPIQRPLVYDFQHDENCRGIQDQFTFGEHILVAPVIEQGARERQVYLPAGCWYSLGSVESYRGGRYYTVQAPLNFCPAFVREGAVVPSARIVQTTANYAPEEIILNVYLPPTDGEWVSFLHEDDGKTDRYRHGEYYRTEFRVTRRGEKVTLRGATSGDGYEGFSRTAFKVRVFGPEITERVIPNRGEDFELDIK